MPEVRSPEPTSSEKCSPARPPSPALPPSPAPWTTPRHESLALALPGLGTRAVTAQGLLTAAPATHRRIALSFARMGLSVAIWNRRAQRR